MYILMPLNEETSKFWNSFSYMNAQFIVEKTLEYMHMNANSKFHAEQKIYPVIGWPVAPDRGAGRLTDQTVDVELKSTVFANQRAIRKSYYMIWIIKKYPMPKVLRSSFWLYNFKMCEMFLFKNLTNSF